MKPNYDPAFNAILPGMLHHALGKFWESFDEQDQHHIEGQDCTSPGECKTKILVDWLMDQDHQDLAGLALDLLGYQAWVRTEEADDGR